ncbi:divergent polysaccharide deacetylase family protein [bacterium]|nr:MAG: divergent polysaccharide deacetylase family protein [bacterium]
MAKRKKHGARGGGPTFLQTALLVVLALVVGALTASYVNHRAAARSYGAPRHHIPVESIAVATPSAVASAPAVRAAPEAALSPSPRNASAGSAAPLPAWDGLERDTRIVASAPRPVSTTQAGGIHLPKVTGRPRVAIIVDDCGQWIDTERGFLALPVPLTLSVLPDVRYTRTIAQEAQDAGKGVMLHLPMEPLSHMNPGPGKITTEMSDGAITAQVEDDLAQVPLAAGVNNHEGSAATANPRVMRDVLGVLKSRDKFFIDSLTTGTSVAGPMAGEDGIPTASRDVFLDNQESIVYTEAMLEKLVEVAQRKGSAIAIGHPRPTTLAALRAMIPQMESAGVQFVLARDLVH